MFETSKSAETSRSLRSASRCSRPFSMMPATRFAIVCRYSISSRSKPRSATDCTFTTPTTSSWMRSGTDSIEVKRSSSTPGTHLKRGSARTWRTAAGTRAFATQPVIPSPTRSVAFPMNFRFRPFVATRRRTPSRRSSRYSDDTSTRIASVVRSMTMRSISSQSRADDANWATSWRNESSRSLRSASMGGFNQRILQRGVSGEEHAQERYRVRSGSGAGAPVQRAKRA